MDYVDFQKKIKEEMGKRLGSGYVVKIQTVQKNNSNLSAGLSICKKNQKISPIIYLEQFYFRYLKEKNISVLYDEIINIYHSTACKREQYSNMDIDFEKCKSKIIYRLISKSKNKELLEEMPYIPFLDLAIVFSILFDTKNDMLESIRISNILMERWDISTQLLYKYAKYNTPLLFPAKIKDLNEVCSDIFLDNDTEFGKYENLPTQSPFIILTNENGIQGASVLLYKDVLHEIAESIGCDVYILPSSIHEGVTR